MTDSTSDKAFADVARGELDDSSIRVQFFNVNKQTWCCSLSGLRYGCNAFADTKAAAFERAMESAQQLRRSAA